MTKSPEIIKVSGHYYHVSLEDDNWSNQTGCWGQCDKLTQTLRIAKSLPPALFADTLWHEIGHAVFHHYNVPGEEEATVAPYSEGTFQVLRDNPALVKLIGVK